MVACEEVGVSGGEGGGVAEGVGAAVESGESEGEFSTVGGGKDLGSLVESGSRADATRLRPELLAEGRLGASSGPAGKAAAEAEACS